MLTQVAERHQVIINDISEETSSRVGNSLNVCDSVIDIFTKKELLHGTEVQGIKKYIEDLIEGKVSSR
jgi:peroxiredoxin family protein